MSINVGGQDNAKIKLYNGQTIDLNKLDKLVGQSSKGSVFANFDVASNGKNVDNVFDEAEVQAIKNKFLEYKNNENITQDNLNEILGYKEENNKNISAELLTSQLENINKNEQIEQKDKSAEKNNTVTSQETEHSKSPELAPPRTMNNPKIMIK